jgi:integrase/recombinase XerD
MKRRSKDLLALVQNYFHDYLRGVRGASEHTIRAYSDALRLFFAFLADHVRRPIARLELDDIRADAVLAFLQHVESSRRNATTTRNCRLAAIRSFVDHLLRHDVTRAEQYGRILEIPTKRAAQKPAPYLEPAEVRAVIAQIADTAIPLCQRHLRQSLPDIFVPMGGEWSPIRAQAIPSSKSRRRPRRGRAQGA